MACGPCGAGGAGGLAILGLLGGLGGLLGGKKKCKKQPGMNPGQDPRSAHLQGLTAGRGSAGGCGGCCSCCRPRFGQQPPGPPPIKAVDFSFNFRTFAGLS
ncbi:MAG: hypothetical protein HY319_10425 [Armatimonadetes bacterium]|nr:hypothetical protein [Armatimonadota bacterium]